MRGKCWATTLWQEDAGSLVYPHHRTEGRDLSPRWTAKFISLMGSPVLGSFQGRTLIMIGTKSRTVDLVLGRGTPF
jgi:hypothetical protein